MNKEEMRGGPIIADPIEGLTYRPKRDPDRPYLIFLEVERLKAQNTASSDQQQDADHRPQRPPRSLRGEWGGKG